MKMDIVYTFTKYEGMYFSFSYDTVYVQDPEFWDKVLGFLKEAGHFVIFNTIRSGTETDIENEDIVKVASKHNCAINFTQGMPLKKYMEEVGQSIEIWIHGYPKSIFKTQTEDNKNFFTGVNHQYMQIAVDFDDTYSADPETFDKIVKLAKKEKNDIRIVTLRDSNIGRSKDIRYICDRLGGRTTRPKANKLAAHFTKLQAKQKFLEGISDNLPINYVTFVPTVWIDDDPKYILDNHPRWAGYKNSPEKRAYSTLKKRESIARKKKRLEEHKKKWSGLE